MKNNPIAPYNLDLGPGDDLIELNGKRFDKKSYSRMKYGVKADLQRFAHELAIELMEAAPQIFNHAKPPAILTSYKAAAPPSTTLARYCLDFINLARFQDGLDPGEMVQVYRPTDYIEEYALLPATERKRLIGNQVTNTLRGRNLDEYLPLILDDIRVTGTYTEMMCSVIGNREDAITAYLVISGPNLQKSAHAEHLLNSSEIKSPIDLLPYIEAGNFVFTRRILKMLLRTPANDLEKFIHAAPDDLLVQIVRGIIDTDSKLKEIFPETSSIILDSATKRLVYLQQKRPAID